MLEYNGLTIGFHGCDKDIGTSRSRPLLRPHDDIRLCFAPLREAPFQSPPSWRRLSFHAVALWGDGGVEAAVEGMAGQGLHAADDDELHAGARHGYVHTA